ncbi:MAG: hypothetical protein WHX52_02430 [Anaerolineae bacterium]
MPSSTPTISPTPSPSSTPTASPAPLAASGLIAFVGKDQRLWFTTPAGQRQGPLTAEGWVQSPAWSPDGKTLAYIHQADGQNHGQVVLYAVDAEQSDTLVEAPEHAGALEWSPDGRHLLLDSGTGAVRQLAVVEVASGAVLYETSALGYAWSPDGLHLALGLRQPLDTPISLETGDSVSLAILVLEAREMQVVFAGTSERLYFPRAWLPDGRLFFEQLDWDERLQTGDDSRWTMHYITGRIDEPQPTQDIPTAFDREAILARLPEEFRSASTHSFSWSSDGQCMVFQSGNSIYLFDWAAGGEPRLLADGASPVWQPLP